MSNLNNAHYLKSCIYPFYHFFYFDRTENYESIITHSSVHSWQTVRPIITRFGPLKNFFFENALSTLPPLTFYQYLINMSWDRNALLAMVVVEGETFECFSDARRSQFNVSTNRTVAFKWGHRTMCRIFFDVLHRFDYEQTIHLFLDTFFRTNTFNGCFVEWN